MVRLPFNEGQLLLVLLCLFLATGFVTGCVFLGVAQFLVSRLTAKQLQWQELFLATPLTRRVCSICARVPSGPQVVVKKDA